MGKLLWIFMLPTSLLWADFGIQNQVELHSKYQKLAFGLHDALIYVRLEGAIDLPKTWQLYLRLDIPYLWLWGKQAEIISIGDNGIVVPPGQPGSHTIVKKSSFREVGLSDIGSRFFFVTPYIDRIKSIAFGFGSEFGFPTAQEPDLGTGKYWARPIIGVRFRFPQLGYGSLFDFFAKYQFSFAGHKDRSSFQIFAFQPVFVYTFVKKWALILAPEIQYNVREETWFVPISANLTKTFTKHFSISAAYQKGIVADFPVFKNEVELTLRYAF